MGSDPPGPSHMLTQRLGTSGETPSEPLFIFPAVGKTHLCRGHEEEVQGEDACGPLEYNASTTVFLCIPHFVPEALYPGTLC